MCCLAWVFAGFLGFLLVLKEIFFLCFFCGDFLYGFLWIQRFWYCADFSGTLGLLVKGIMKVTVFSY